MGNTKEHSFFNHTKLWEKWTLFILLLLFVFGVGMDVSDQPLYERVKAWALALWALIFLCLLIPAGLRCAEKGIKSVWSVVGLSVFVLAVVLLVFYTCYFWVVSASNQDGVGFDKLLNFPPMLAALWAAGVGWYITFQAAAKNHRTTNSFNLLMQTRTNREFLDRAKLVQLTYPHGSDVPVEDEHLFASASLKELTARAEEQKADGNDVAPELQDLLCRSQAADALKYLLNYYEFMAVGIEAKDLEENLLYETIGVTVVSVYGRGKPFIDYIRGPQKGNQPLAFCALNKLVERWEKRLKTEINSL